MYSKTDDASSKLIQYNEHPVVLEEYGFTPKQINAPETVLCMAQEDQPGRPFVTRIRWNMCRQDSPDDILVNIGAERKVDLLCYSWTAEGGIAPLHFDNSGYEFLGGTLWARFAIATGGIKESIFTLFEQLVKFQQR